MKWRELLYLSDKNVIDKPHYLFFFAVTSFFLRFELTSNLPQIYLKFNPCSNWIRIEIEFVSNLKGNFLRCWIRKKK